jgi:hypothetical protein
MNNQLSFDLGLSQYSPYAIKKYSKINGDLVIDIIDIDVAKKMIIENHYSKKWNMSFGLINIGIFRDTKLLGCAVFGNMMHPQSYKSIADIDQRAIMELNRLWISDDLGKNAETILISKSFDIIKKKMPYVKLIQSFADGRLGVGTIYKAASFNYYGFKTSKFFKDIDTGEFYHEVPFSNTRKGDMMVLRNKLYLDKKIKVFLVKTYKYIYLLNRKVKIKFKQLPYPSYEKGMEEIVYEHPIGVLCRLYLMYQTRNDIEYMNKAINELEIRFSKKEIDEELIKQSKSDQILTNGGQEDW